MAWYSRFFPQKKKTVTVIKPDTASVKVTDYVGGTSKTTSTITSGSTGKTSTTVRRSGGGTSYTPPPPTPTPTPTTTQKTNLLGKPVVQPTTQSQDPIYQAVASRFKQQNVNKRFTREDFARQVNIRREQEKERRRQDKARKSVAFVKKQGEGYVEISKPIDPVVKPVVAFATDPTKAVVVSRYSPVSLLLPKDSGGRTKDFTLTSVKESYRTGLGTPGKVVAELTPSTFGGAGLFVGFGGVYSKLPQVARIGVGGAITYTGIRGAADPSRTKEARIASGIVGVAGATGTIFEAFPYAKGLKARVSPDYAPTVKQPEGFSAVQLAVNKRIGLIPEGSPARTGVTSDVKLPATSPLKRGGFGVKESEKGLFVKADQLRTSSQQGLFSQGKDVVIEREFFATPQDPFAKIPITRVSRLGLSDALKVQKNVEVGFGIPKQPQIAVIKGGKWELGKGSELEFIKTSGVLTDVKKIGVTSIRGQGVDIYTAKAGGIGGGKSITPSLPSTKSTQRISGEGVITTSLFYPKTRFNYPSSTSNKLFSTSTLVTTTPIISTTITPPPSTPTVIIHGGSTPYIPTPRSPPILPPTSPPISPPKTPKLPTLTPPISPPTMSPPRTPPFFPTTPPKPPRYKQRSVRQRTSYLKIPVFLRRFGKFKIVGYGRTQKEAVGIGRSAASKTLGATFKVPTYKGKKIKGFRTKKTKEGTEFIELPKFRLSTGTEKKEIKYFKQLKGGKKKKKNGK